MSPYSLQPTPYTLHLTPNALQPCSLHPTPYTLFPTPYNPAVYTIHPTPCTLHPTLYTLHPTPYTLQATVGVNHFRLWTFVGKRLDPVVLDFGSLGRDQTFCCARFVFMQYKVLSRYFSKTQRFVSA